MSVDDVGAVVSGENRCGELDQPAREVGCQLVRVLQGIFQRLSDVDLVLGRNHGGHVRVDRGENEAAVRNATIDSALSQQLEQGLIALSITGGALIGATDRRPAKDQQGAELSVETGRIGGLPVGRQEQGLQLAAQTAG